MGGQDRSEHGRSDGVPATTDVEREFRGKLADARRPAALPLRPDQAQVLPAGLRDHGLILMADRRW